MASYMLVCSGKAGGISQLVFSIKTMLMDEMVDPYLHTTNDEMLQAYLTPSGTEGIVYGSEEDDAAALNVFSTKRKDGSLLGETVLSHMMRNFEKLPEEDMLSMKDQLLQGFSPEDAFPLGLSLFMETPKPCTPLAQKDSQSYDKIMPLSTLEDEDIFPDTQSTQSGRKMSKMSESKKSLDVLSANQLILSVLETARQVASLPVSTAPLPYDEMKSQCEALVVGKQQKMSVLLSLKHRQDAADNDHMEEKEKALAIMHNPEKSSADQPRSNGRGQSSRRCDNFFRLPPSSPYDKFLKAAGVEETDCVLADCNH